MPLVIAFVTGAIVGSFLNVCIRRLPAGESVVFPASHCRSCRRPIAWYDNIPCVSYFILRGRCRNCGSEIPPQVVIIEFLTGALFVLFAAVFGPGVKGFVYLALSLAFLVEGVIDFRHEIIPDSITLPGIALGLLLSAVFPSLHGEAVWWRGLLWSFVGMLAGGGILYVVGAAAEWILKKEAMGGGDVKLLAMTGAVLGWQAVLWTVFVSSLLGTIVGVYLKSRGGGERIPYGPFLAMGAFLYIFFGQPVIGWYFRWIG